ncbi:MAG TPA: HAD family hydrolase [Thermomicrobiales bacterium]|nr:HAD family hydrolase [Thermomicrobiales bacterium]
MGGTGGPPCLTFMLDVDNTLLDNDAAKVELDRRLRALIGEDEAARFWRIYEEVRADAGVVSYPLTLAAFDEDARANRRDLLRDEAAWRASCGALASLLLDFPYRDFVFPGAPATIAHLRALGAAVILSDGDPAYQPLKIARSGLGAAADNCVLVYAHKEEHLREVRACFPADHYVLVEDKPNVIDKVRARLAAPLTTVLVRQGKYAAAAARGPWSGADLAVDAVGDLRRYSAADFLAASNQPSAISHQEFG